MPRVYIETYGCQMNVSDSELILGVLRRDGYVAAAEPAEADVVLVNTCAVRDHAEQKVISRLGEHPLLGVVVDPLRAGHEMANKHDGTTVRSSSSSTSFAAST